MTKIIKEGPEWGPESAAAYKADTPGQEGADNVPYKSEDNIVNDDIQKMIEIVSKKIMGLKEQIVRHYSQWSIIESYLDQYGTEGIDKLVEDATMKSVAGKPLRSVVEEKELDEEKGPVNIDSMVQKPKTGMSLIDRAKAQAKASFEKNLQDTAKKHNQFGINARKVLAKREKLKESVNPDELMDDKNLQEISDKKMKSYGDAAFKQVNDLDDKSTKRKLTDKELRTMKKRDKGLDKVAKKLSEAIKDYASYNMTVDQIKEATLGGAARVNKPNPNNVKSKKSGFTINTKMNDAYGKVADAKGHARKRLLQKGKAAFNVGHAKKMVKEENIQELSKNPVAQKAKSYSNGYRRKADNAFDRGDDAEMERQNDKADNAQKRYKSAMRKKLSEGLKKGDYGHEKEKAKVKADQAWRDRMQKEYDGPNSDGKSAKDGVRRTGD